ncbi:MAG: Carboxypeptidase precursor [Betaproteobacteria bacterium]|nr:Carboxypeptidase precursor [Betaproteobacteria bacterium]
MKKNTTIKGLAATASFMLCTIAAAGAAEQPMQSVLVLAQKEKPSLLDTLKELTAIESGSREPEALDRIANVLAAKLRALGGKVELIEPTEAGLRGFGSHTTNAEYILINSIEPRLYLAARMIMDVARGLAPLK